MAPKRTYFFTAKHIILTLLSLAEKKRDNKALKLEWNKKISSDLGTYSI